MDILVLAKSLDNSDPDPVTGEDTFEAFVLWGDHDQSKDTHKILCPEKSLKQRKYRTQKL